MPAREPATYVEAARNLASQVYQFRQEIDRQRTLPAALVTEMTNAGFFSLWVCRALGGPELSFAEFLRVVKELSHADGAVGWCAMVATVWSRLSGYVAQYVGGARSSVRATDWRAASTRQERPSPSPAGSASPGAGAMVASSSAATGPWATQSCRSARGRGATAAARPTSAL